MKNVLVRGPALSQSGYGEHARMVLRALRYYEDKYNIFLIPTNWGKTSWIFEDDEERAWYDHLIGKTLTHTNNKGDFDVSVQVTIPNEWERLAPINIGVTAGIETTKAAPEWVDKAAVVDRIITISEHSKQTYLAARSKDGKSVTTPIDIVRYPVRKFEPDPDFNLELEHDFNFLVMAQVSPRKNVENTIKWFVEDHFDLPVGIVLKLNMAKNCLLDYRAMTSTLKGLLGEYKGRRCSVNLIHGYLTEQEKAALYTHPKIKSFLSISHGEGYHLPMFEAAYHGMPVIAPEYSGYLDFMCLPSKKDGKKKAAFAKVDYTLRPLDKKEVWDGVLDKNSQWCHAERNSFRLRCREMREEYDRFKSVANRLQSHLIENYTEESIYALFEESIAKTLEGREERSSVFTEV